MILCTDTEVGNYLIKTKILLILMLDIISMIKEMDMGNMLGEMERSVKVSGLRTSSYKVHALVI